MHPRRGADLGGQFGSRKRIEERIELMDDETRASQIYNAMRIRVSSFSFFLFIF